MSTPYENQRDQTRRTIETAQRGRTVYDDRGRSAGTQWPAFETLAVAEAILTLAEAIRPAPVEVKVEVDEERIVQSVRDAMDGGAK